MPVVFSLSKVSGHSVYQNYIVQKIGDILMIYKFGLRTNLQGGENGGLELLDIEGRDNCIC